MTQPTIDRFHVGDIQVLGLSDGWIDVPLDYFPQAKAEGLGDATAPVHLGANVWVLQTDDRTILVDAGSGSALLARFPETGKLLSALDTIGTRPADITDVVLTHMHADHIGGLVSEGASVFTNAAIHVDAVEWGFWTDPGLLAASPDDFKPLVQLVQGISTTVAPQVTPYETETDLGGGIRFVPAPGHTPGHRVVHLASGSAQTMLIGDAIISGALQFAHPDIGYALDSDPVQAAATRRSLFDRLAADGIPFAATHLDHPGRGTVVPDANAYRFMPTD